MWWYYPLAAAGIVIILWAFYAGLVVRTYTVRSKKVRRPFRIVQVSDLHSMYHGENQIKLLQKIEQQNPDLVVLTGDIFHVSGQEAGGISFLKQICRYPCFYVLGNHEYSSGKAQTYMDLAESLGIHVLSDNSVPFSVNGNDIRVCGVNDPQRGRIYEPGYNMQEALEQAFSALDSKTFHLLLAHSHIYIQDYKKYKFDLVLAGHSHGGQFRIPFLMNGFFVKQQGFFPRYAGGEYHFGGLTYIVSRGVSAKPEWVPRIFNPTELVVIDVVPEQ